MSPSNEELIWRGSSSHVRNLGLHLLCWLVCPAVIIAAVWLWQAPEAYWLLPALIVPLSISFWTWLTLRTRVYELTTERLKITRGVFAKRTDDLELYRVRDTSLEQPFLYRLFNRGNIVLHSTDATTPTVVMECVPAPVELRDRLRRAVEDYRDRKRARVAEFTGPLETDAGETATT